MPVCKHSPSSRTIFRSYSPLVRAFKHLHLHLPSTQEEFNQLKFSNFHPATSCIWSAISACSAFVRLLLACLGWSAVSAFSRRHTNLFQHLRKYHELFPQLVRIAVSFLSFLNLTNWLTCKNLGTATCTTTASPHAPSVLHFTADLCFK